jgi:O-antigen/teichoic acid export membrane protein
MYAANVMYQFAILSFIATVISAPYNAAIAAKERMDVFAFVGVAGSLLQLVSVLFLKFCIFPDALIAYAVFIFINSFLVSFYSIFYCRKYFDFCQFVLRLFDRSLIKEMAFFALWNMTATICNLLRNHGVNMLINMFFNPVVNAARAIAMQVSGAVNNFSYNFYTAVRPQLVKYYSSGNNDKMLELGYLSSRFSFLLLFALTVPIYCEAEGILSLWLKDVPDNTILIGLFAAVFRQNQE